MYEKNDFYNATDDFIDRNVREGRGEHTALIYDGRRYTYRHHQKFVNKTGNALKAMGIDIGDHILLLMHDSPEFVESFWGAIKIGAIPIPLNTILQPEDYEYLLNDSRGKVLVVHESLLPKIESITGNINFLRDMVVIKEGGGAKLPYNQMFKRASSVLEPAPTTYDDVAFWLYSSGSTGFPKGTVHLQHDMAHSADSYAGNILNIKEDDIIFSASKLFFAYGLGNSMYFPYHVGACSILYPARPVASAIFEVIQRERPTIFFGVPTLYNNMLTYYRQHGNQYPTDIMSSVRCCVSAGEALPPKIFQEWKDTFGLEILDGIGSTEMCHIFISNRPGMVKPASTGMVVPGYEAKIVDEDWNELPTGEIGNLVVKGDSSAIYYWRNHKKTQETMVGEWINTGDKYCQDDEGYYYYAGRSDDMFKVGGIWVSPFEVENALLEHIAVFECAVVCSPDSENLIKPKAFVVLNENILASDDLEEKLKIFVKSKIAPYKYPRWIEFIEKLPKTSTGKIQRYKLR
ncbi:MAG: benzoate-CoA ligase family protein [Candidatus Thermoplasmatota archaeon]|jgi:benzoate-CoA ligase|nr:benzoate-CoA ligase family protein [Candidatus Thermoplasmatota archaeon]MDP7264421.1 benzoate-CoA ligase family protein [Candidatus Thermoplasmatota archaeon]